MTVAMVKYNYYKAQFRIIVCFDLLYSKPKTERHFLQIAYPASDFQSEETVEYYINRTGCFDCFYGDIYLINMVSVE